MKTAYLTIHVTRALADYIIGTGVQKSSIYLKDKLSIDVEVTQNESELVITYEGFVIDEFLYYQKIHDLISNVGVNTVASLWGDILGVETEVDPTEEYILY